MEALIDGGASLSLINENIYRRIASTNPLDLGIQVDLYNVELRKLLMLGTANSEVVFDNFNYGQRFR